MHTPTPPADLNPWGMTTRHTLSAGGLTFETWLLPAGIAFDLLPMLSSLLAGPSAVVVDLVRTFSEGGLEGADVSGSTVADALLMLAAQIVAHGGSARAKEILSNTYAIKPDGGKALVSDEFDVIFQGRMPALMQVLAWVIKVNFLPLADAGRAPAFLTQALDWLNQFKPPQPSGPASSTSPKAATGSGSGSRASGRSRRAK